MKNQRKRLKRRNGRLPSSMAPLMSLQANGKATVKPTKKQERLEPLLPRVELSDEDWRRLEEEAAAAVRKRAVQTQIISRKPKKALEPMPLPLLEGDYGAAKGWLYLSGKYAETNAQVKGLAPSLQWTKYYFVLDPAGPTLMQFLHPMEQKAVRVLVLDEESVISAQGMRRLDLGNGKQLSLFTFQVGAGDERNEDNALLGCSEEGVYKRWLQFIRSAVQNKPTKDLLLRTRQAAVSGANNGGQPRNNNEEQDTCGDIHNLTVFDGTSLQEELTRMGILLEDAGDGSGYRVISKQVKQATKIQSCVRMWLAYRFVFGTFGVKHRFCMAKEIQRVFRGFQVRLVVQERMERFRAARCIQCLWRRFHSRQLVKAARLSWNSATCIQRSVRAYLARRIIRERRRVRELLLGEFLSEMIEKVEEVHQAYLLELENQKRNTAATKIQCECRRYLAKLELNERKRHLSATQLQAWFRAISGKLRFAFQKSTVKKIQAIVRGRIGRIHAAEVAYETQCATKIQALWRQVEQRRQWLIIKNAGERLCQFGRFVLAQRAFLAAMRLRALRTSRAIQIQALTRAYLAWTMVHREKYGLLPRFRAARRIQSWVRCLRERQRYFKVRGATLKLQCFARKLKSQRLARLAKEKRQNDAARCIQRAFRSWMLWCNIMERRSAGVEAFASVGKVLFRGGVLFHTKTKSALAKVTVISKAGDLSCEVFFPSLSASRVVSVGNWFIALFMSWQVRDGMFRSGSSHFGKSLAAFVASLLYASGHQEQHQLVAPILASKIRLPSAYGPLEHERAVGWFWKSVMGHFKTQDYSVYDVETRDSVREKIGFEETKHTSLAREIERFENQVSTASRNVNVQAVLAKMDKQTDEYAFAKALHELGRSSRVMFARTRTKTQQRIVVLRSLPSQRLVRGFGDKKELVKEFCETWVTHVLKAATSSFTDSPGVETRVEAELKLVEDVERLLGESVDPTRLFEFDFRAFAAELRERTQTLKSLLENEKALLEVSSSASGLETFDAELSHTREVLLETTQRRSELMEDIRRWKESRAGLEEKLQNTDPEDADTILMLEKEISYLETKLEKARHVIDHYVETIGHCSDHVGVIEDYKRRMQAARVEMKYLVETVRKKRLQWQKREKEAFEQGGPLFFKCEQEIGILTGALVAQDFRTIRLVEMKLSKFLHGIRHNIEELKACRSPLQEMVNLQQVVVQEAMDAMRDFVSHAHAQLGRCQTKRMELLGAQELASSHAVESILALEAEVFAQQATYEKTKAAEEEMRRIIEEEEKEYEEHAAYEESLKPKTGRARLDELEEEIGLLVPGFLDDRFDKMIRTIRHFSSSSQQFSFEANQVEMARNKFACVIACVEEKNLAKAKDEAEQTVKRMKGSIYLFKELQSKYEHELRDERMGMGGGRVASQVSDSGSSSGSDSSSDGESDWSSDSEDSDAPLNIGLYAEDTLAELRDVQALVREYNKYAERMITEGEENAVPVEFLKGRAALLKEKEEQEGNEQDAPDGNQGSRRRKFLGSWTTRRNVAASMRSVSRKAFESAVKKGKKTKEIWTSKYQMKAKKLVEDPFGRVAARRQAAVIDIQRVVRGWLVRFRRRTKAALVIQGCVRNWLARRRFLQALYDSTYKYYDFATSKYFYVWLGKSAWEPPSLLNGKYIKYGKRRRKHGHVWSEAEAATVIQAAYRARLAQRLFVWMIHESYEKVYEPSKDTFFYQNVVSGRCQWHKPVGLREEDDIRRVFYPGVGTVWSEDTYSSSQTNQTISYNTFTSG